MHYELKLGRCFIEKVARDQNVAAINTAKIERAAITASPACAETI
jgi:hypothetical protein